MWFREAAFTPGWSFSMTEKNYWILDSIEMKKAAQYWAAFLLCIPEGIRTPVTGMKTRCPRPLDDGDMLYSYFYFVSRRGIEPRTHCLKGSCSTDWASDSKQSDNLLQNAFLPVNEIKKKFKKFLVWHYFIQHNNANKQISIFLNSHQEFYKIY